MGNGKMVLFNILKLNTSYILHHHSHIALDYTQALDDNVIVSLGDNQLFTFIRRLNNQEDLPDRIVSIKQKIESLQEEPNSIVNIQKITELRNELKQITFIPDIVSVKADTTKKDYKAICKDKFEVDIQIGNVLYHRKYKRLCAGAGQLRRNSAMFCNEELYNELETIMLCGLTKNQIGKINLAKFSAYFALYTSATREVTIPRICVVDDFEYTLKNQTVDWIFDNENGEKDIEERVVDFDINAFDGSGILSPRMAEQWVKDLSLDYTPTSFIIRSAWIKGLLSIFDFHKFAKEIAHTDKIKDHWGTEYNINDIDVIMTTSQFKLYKKYQNWEEYTYYHKKFKHIFSVARVNKAEDNYLTALNYQYIQTNDFTEESIKELADYSISWANKIMSKDYLYALLLLEPNKTGQDSIQSVDERTLDDNLTEALMYCPELINDKYVNSKMTRHIQSKIDKMKVGKLWVEGAYEFTIPDLYAMAEHAFGMEVKGLLPANSIWNRRWVEKGSKQVTSMRSPLVAPSENRLLDVYNNERCLEWFQYIKSGTIFNIWDMTLIAQSDADYDGDLVLTSDNPILIKAVGCNRKIITYEKSKSKEQRLNMNGFAAMDVKSFNTKIGVITNIASNLISLKSIYEPTDAEYIELDRRIKLLRYYQGTAIDSAKGDIFIPPPKFWSKKQKYIMINDEMTEEQRQAAIAKNQEIIFNNNIAVDRKAYFFGYVYPNLKEEYDVHVKSYKTMCKQLYHTTITELNKKENKTPREKALIKNYYKHMPLLRNNCTMNLLAYYIENAELDNKWGERTDNNFDYRILLSKGFKPNNVELFEAVKDAIFTAYRNYNKRIRIVNSAKGEVSYDRDAADNVERNVYVKSEDELRENLYKISSNIELLSNYVIYAYYTYFTNRSRSWMWNIFGTEIVKHIKDKATKKYFPVECDDGMEYLGKKYKLESVDLIGTN